MIKCEWCNGTSWNRDVIHPLFGQMYDWNRPCPKCDGQGWMKTDDPANSAPEVPGPKA